MSELFKLVGPALEKVKSKVAAPEVDPDFEKYAGLYRSAWGETAIVPWEDGLAMISLPTNSPADGLTRLRHVKGHVFSRIWKDGDMVGEEIIFEVGPHGRVSRLSRHGNFSNKVQ